MSTSSPRLNPQPEPPSFAIVGDDTVRLQTGSGVLKIHWKTGEVEYVPEMPILESTAKVLLAASATWQATRNVKGLEKMHTQAAAMLASAAEVVCKETTRKAMPARELVATR
jgi:hypothetical protein